MAKYDITHKCGHTVEHNIVGTDVNGERGRKADWLASHVCVECSRAEQYKVSNNYAEDLALPALTGSEKQIAWATTIRSKAVKEASEFLHEATAKAEKIVERDPSKREQAEKAYSEYRRVFAALCDKTSASWWIDNRGLGGQSILREVMEEVAQA